LGSKVAVCVCRAVLRLRVQIQLPLAGSYRSALPRSPPVLLKPAATRTLPLASKVAVCDSCAVLRLPVAVQVAGQLLSGNVATGVDPKRSGSAIAFCLVMVRCASANGITQTANSRSR